MRFAAVLLLTSFVTMAIADDGKPTAKASVILSPEKKMEKAISEYKKIVTDYYQFERVVQAPAMAKGVHLIGNPHRTLRLEKHKKSTEVINLHKSLSILPDPDLYKKSKDRRIELASQFEKLYKKRIELEKLDPTLSSDEFVSLGKSFEDVGIELSMVTLVEQLNTVKQ